jgi:hypothetical protein
MDAYAARITWIHHAPSQLDIIIMVYLFISMAGDDKFYIECIKPVLKFRIYRKGHRKLPSNTQTQ